MGKKREWVAAGEERGWVKLVLVLVSLLRIGNTGACAQEKEKEPGEGKGCRCEGSQGNRCSRILELPGWEVGRGGAGIGLGIVWSQDMKGGSRGESRGNGQEGFDIIHEIGG